MVETLWARSTLLEPPFVLYIGKTWSNYGPNIVKIKYDVMKIPHYIWDLHLSMFKTIILPQEQMKCL